MQHEVTVVQKLLDQQGYVVTPGWARRPVWQYNRENIAAPSFRIKEWDYYLAGNEHYAVAFTLSDLGYAGLISVSLIDLVERKEHTETILTAMPMGRMGLGAEERRMAFRQSVVGFAPGFCHLHAFAQFFRSFVPLDHLSQEGVTHLGEEEADHHTGLFLLFTFRPHR